MDAVREIATDSLRFWETRRLVYNAILLGETLVVYMVMAPLTGVALDGSKLGMIGVFAVIANLLFCAAYPIDLFVQLSEYRDAWRRSRVWLFALGTGFAVFLTGVTSLMLFSTPMID